MSRRIVVFLLLSGIAGCGFGHQQRRSVDDAISKAEYRIRECIALPDSGNCFLALAHLRTAKMELWRTSSGTYGVRR